MVSAGLRLITQLAFGFGSPHAALALAMLFLSEPAPPATPKYHLIRIVSPNGYAQSNAYDGAALASETGGPADRTMLYAYDTSAPETAGTPSTSTTTITDPKGHVVVARHSNYLLSSLTRGSGSAQEATSSFTRDPLGSTRAITDQTGNVSATSTYDPYGNPASQTGTLANPFGYAGQYTDPETGLQYLRARYYDPNGLPPVWRTLDRWGRKASARRFKCREQGRRSRWSSVVRPSS